MSLVDRPDILLYAQWSDEWVDTRGALQRAEWEIEKFVASCVREAITNKTRGTSKNVDVAKIIGNNVEQEQTICVLKEKIFALKDKMNSLQVKMKVWEHVKDLYQTDSYHTIRGSIKTFSEEDNTEL